MKKMNPTRMICVVLILLMIAVGTGSVMFAETLPTNGLVAYYPFNGNANDESGNGNHGMVYGATLTVDRFGNANSAYSFDGMNDYIVTNYSGILGKNPGTISLWLKTAESHRRCIGV
jgi:hypothetical protein